MNLLSMPKLNILMEKPFTTDIQEAKLLHSSFNSSVLSETSSTSETSTTDKRILMVNHSANWRKQTRLACETVSGGRIGKVYNGFNSSH